MASVWRAWQAFERGKMASSAILAFRSNLEIELLGLQKDLVSGRYRHGSYDSFVVYEPKRREIAVAQVRDRVVHRLLYDYLVVVWDKSFCYDAWNCRKNKGLHGAISRAQYYVRRYKDSWIWRSDISKFFDNVDHSHLRFILKTKMASTRAMKLLDKVIDSYNYQSVSQSVSPWFAHRQSDQSGASEHLSQRIRPVCTAVIKTARLCPLR